MIGLTVEQLAEIISLADAHGRRTMRYVCDGHEVDSRQANEAYRTLIDTLRTAIGPPAYLDVLERHERRTEALMLDGLPTAGVDA